MGVLKITKIVEAANIYVRLYCPDCGRNFRAHLKGSLTQKACVHCSTGLFHIMSMGVRGGVQVEATFTGRATSYKRTPIDVSSEDIELDES